MDESSIHEVRRFKRHGEPYFIYYSPGMVIQAHDHNYILRLLSDQVASQRPKDFNLLPQFRSLNTP